MRSAPAAARGSARAGTPRPPPWLLLDARWPNMHASWCCCCPAEHKAASPPGGGGGAALYDALRSPLRLGCIMQQQHSSRSRVAGRRGRRRAVCMSSPPGRALAEATASCLACRRAAAPAPPPASGCRPPAGGEEGAPEGTGPEEKTLYSRPMCTAKTHAHHLINATVAALAKALPRFRLTSKLRCARDERFCCVCAMHGRLQAQRSGRSKKGGAERFAALLSCCWSPSYAPPAWQRSPSAALFDTMRTTAAFVAQQRAPAPSSAAQRFRFPAVQLLRLCSPSSQVPTPCSPFALRLFSVPATARRHALRGSRSSRAPARSAAPSSSPVAQLSSLAPRTRRRRARTLSSRPSTARRTRPRTCRRRCCAAGMPAVVLLYVGALQHFAGRSSRGITLVGRLAPPARQLSS